MMTNTKRTQWNLWDSLSHNCNFFKSCRSFVHILWIPGLYFYGIFVCANTYVSASICVSYAFSLGLFLLFVLSDFCLIAFISFYLVSLFFKCLFVF